MSRCATLLLAVALVAGCATGPDPSIGSVAQQSERASPVTTDKTAVPAVSPATSPTTPAPPAAPTTRPVTPSGPPASAAPAGPTIEWTSRSVPAHTSAGGGGVAFSGSGGRLHVVVSNLDGAVLRYVEGEKVADDGSAYLWTRDLGRTWSRERILEGYGPRIAATGDDVYLALVAYACDSAAAVMRNPRNGVPRAWSKPVCLGRDGTDVEIAAAGRGVYAATIDEAGRVAVWTSRDRGRIFKRTWLVRSSNWGRYLEGIAASGPRVLVATSGQRGGLWTSDDAGASWARAAGIPAGRLTAVAASARLQAIAGLTMEPDGDGEPQPVAAWVAVRRADGPWTQLDPLPGSGEDVLTVNAIVVGADGSVDVIATGWEGDCGQWARWTDGAGWTDLQPVPGCPDDPGIILTRDGTPVVLTYDEAGDFEYAIALGTVTPGR